MALLNGDSSFQVIGCATKYKLPSIPYLNVIQFDQIDLNQNIKIPGLLKRMISKVIPVFPIKNLLQNYLDKRRPDLVIISQGTNIGSEDIVGICQMLGLKYVILTHLVNLSNWLKLDEGLRLKLIDLHRNALKSYFVSQQNILLHQRMLGYDFANNDIAYNPISFARDLAIPYPETNTFRFAIVGRLECYHKGLDILFDVLEKGHWKDRNAEFHFYGAGPHQQLLSNRAMEGGLKMVHFHGFADDIVSVWRSNHILLLPSRMEGQSISLAEALALNRTVVATAVGGIEEWIKDNESGFVASYAIEASLEEALERAWDMRDEWESMGMKAGNSWRSTTPENPVSNFAFKLKSLLQ